MSLAAVLIAAPDLAAESELVSALTGPTARVRTVRRCVDAIDLLGAAAAGGAQIAFVGAGLPRLSSDAIARLRTEGVRIIGLHDVGDDSKQQMLNRLGIDTVIAVRVSDVSAVVRMLDQQREALTAPPIADRHEAGRTIAVWGPYGSPGRTTISVALADECARQGATVMLVDADPHGGAVGAHLGMLDESSGLVAACRRADQGVLDLAGLARSARSLSRELRVLTGLDAPTRWSHVRPAALARVLRLSSEAVDLTIVDAGFCLDDGADVSRGRAAATLASVQAADRIIAVTTADQVGISRLASALPELRGIVGDVPVHVVVNRVRDRAVGRDAQRQIVEALRRLCDVSDALLLPDDSPTCDDAIREGRTLAEVAPRSELRGRLKELAIECARSTTLRRVESPAA